MVCKSLLRLENAPSAQRLTMPWSPTQEPANVAVAGVRLRNLIDTGSPCRRARRGTGQSMASPASALAANLSSSLISQTS